MLEAPTQKEYRITGMGKRRALIDVQIYPRHDGEVNVELKQGQHNIKKPKEGDPPRADPIEKDLRKLLAERVYGCAMFHILQSSDSGTLGSLGNKYKNALAEARQTLEKDGHKIESKWFVLFVLVKGTRLCRCRAFSDITKVSPNDLDIENFEDPKTMQREENSP